MKTHSQKMQQDLMLVIEAVAREFLVCRNEEHQSVLLLTLQNILPAHDLLLGLSLSEGFKGASI